MKRMKIGIIGAGNMGSAFARRFAVAGHEIAITAKDLAHAEKAASSTGSAVRAVPLHEIARGADLLILAVPYAAAVDALKAAGDVRGKTIIDITNPLTPDMAGLSIGFTTSAAEEIQKAVPGSHIIKAFNTIFAQIVGAEAGATKAQVLFAGDDAAAKGSVRELIEGVNFEAVDVGPLTNARLLEPLGMLNIFLGYMAGRGTGVAPAWVTIN